MPSYFSAVFTVSNISQYKISIIIIIIIIKYIIKLIFIPNFDFLYSFQKSFWSGHTSKFQYPQSYFNFFGGYFLPIPISIFIIISQLAHYWGSWIHFVTKFLPIIFSIIFLCISVYVSVSRICVIPLMHNLIIIYGFSFWGYHNSFVMCVFC